MFCSVFQVAYTVICIVIPWQKECVGWAISKLLFFFFFGRKTKKSEGLICYVVQYFETINQPACYQLLSNSPYIFPPANRLSSCYALCLRFSHLWHARKACSNQAGHSFNLYLTVNCKPVPWSTATIPCFTAKSLISTYCFWKDYNLCTWLLWSDVHKNIKYESKIAFCAACEPNKPLNCRVRYASN